MSLPPLVSDDATLSALEVERYSRQVILAELGMTGQRRLKNSRVLVIGAGGLGSPVLMYLAAAGIGTIGIIDDDTVDESNLGRQIIHGQSDVGRAKLASARESLYEINPHIDVILHRGRFTTNNAVALCRSYDVIVDGTDNFASRYLINDASALAHRPYVWGSIFQFGGQVSVFFQNAPDGQSINYRDIYPTPPAPGSVPSCADGGILGVVCGTIGSIMGTEVIKLITGIGEPLRGRLLIYDATAMDVSTIAIRQRVDAQPITELIDYELFCRSLQEDDVSSQDSVTATQLARMRASGESVVLIDVREPHEYEIAAIDGAVLIPLGEVLSGDGLARVPADTPVVFYCKMGGRSAQALAAAQAAGMANVRHLDGGITAWARDVDTTMPMY